MARNTIIGVGEPFFVTEKETNKKTKMVRLYVVRECMDVYGQYASEVLLVGPACSRIEQFESDVTQLIGLECEIDYYVNSRTGKGKLENFALVLDKVK